MRLAIVDSQGNTVAGRRFRLKVGDLDKEGTVPGDGVVDEEVPANATTGQLLVYWRDGDYEPRPIALALGHLDPPETATGFQARLTNLGYRRGAFTGSPGRRTREGLAAFQADEGLDVTGKPDQPTCALLETRHDKVAP